MGPVVALTRAADTVSLFAALLTIVAAAVAVVTVVLAVGGRVSPALADLRANLAEVTQPAALWLAAAVAATALAGSLWFSEVADFTPCRLCWFQRVAMYPLVPLLVVAAVRRDTRVIGYVLPLTVIGAALSTYHYLIEWFPSLDTGGCDPDAPCALVWFRRFGFASLPFMALAGFAAITSLAFIARSTPRPLEP